MPTVLYKRALRSFKDRATSLLSFPSRYTLIRRDKVAELCRSEFQFRDTVENAVEGIIRTSREGVFIYVNPGFARMLGYDKAEELLRMTDVSRQVYVHPEVRWDFLSRLNANKQARCEYQAWKKDGSTTWLGVSARVVEDGAGRFLYYESIAEDISDRKKRELELDTLARLLAQSNSELQRFAHVVAHDLNEPLRTIGTYASLLEKKLPDALGADGKEYVSFMVSAASRMRLLINDILTFSLVGAEPMKDETVSMAEVASTVLADLQIAAKEAGAQIRVKPLPIVRAQKSKMQRLLQNLISNALKFRRDVPLEITIDATSRQSQWVFEVRDNGIGFDSKHAARIFEFFVQLVDRRQYAGSGMGLAMCKRIVEHHGGRIWAESKAGEGTSVFFSLPQ